jgi:pimeloyl-ACP methyl ester carboxylesterase
MTAAIGAIGVLGALWWALFALKPYEISREELDQRYAHASRASNESAITLEPVSADRGAAFDLRFRAADGAHVVGRIVYPSETRNRTKPFPVLIGMHGLGRTHLRWWQSELRGRATIENTHLITALALEHGYAVVALDARRHGAREPGFAASDLLFDMKLWGKREPYERMIVDTVKDYRTLLDELQLRPELDMSNVRVAGYSMGAQMALLLAAHDSQVHSVAAMVPPHIDDKVAAVSPRRSAYGLHNKRVWLLSANEDEYASREENRSLFDALPSTDKKHLQFDSGHALPKAYVETLSEWLALGKR